MTKDKRQESKVHRWCPWRSGGPDRYPLQHVLRNEVLVVSEAGVGEPAVYRHEALQEDLENAELFTKDHEGDSGNPGEPPLCREEERACHKEED